MQNTLIEDEICFTVVEYKYYIMHVYHVQNVRSQKQTSLII